MADKGGEKGNRRGEDAGEQMQPRFTPKGGSVFPAERKTVKEMMAEKVEKSVKSLVDKNKKKHKTYPGDAS